MTDILLKYGVSGVLAAVFAWGYCRWRGMSLRAEWRCRPWRLVGAWLALSLAIAYGGSKGSYVAVNDPYIQDAGSFVTNTYVHVEIAKRTPLLPDDAEILVYARELSSTNAADWVRLEPHLTFSDHPFNYQVADATNYTYMVAANYIPAPIVHTNGVWSITGFILPIDGGKIAFKQTTTLTIGDNDEE